MTDRSALGRRSRNKGKSFELVARDHLLQHLAHPCFNGTLVIRRSSQAERAWDADLIIEATNAPDWLLGLWVECEHANDPDPWAKMAQATRDAAAATLRSGRQRTPVVIWRETGHRRLWFSTNLTWLNEVMGDAQEGYTAAEMRGHGILVTADLAEVLSRLRTRLPPSSVPQ